MAGLAAALVAAGVHEGDRLGVETNGAIDHVVGLLGAMTIGAIPVPLPADAPMTYAEIVADADPALILAAGGPAMADSVQTDVPSIAIRDAPPSPVLGALSRRPAPTDMAMMYYTSGTSSGVRKGVMQSYLALLTTVRYITAVMQLTGEVREFVASPIDNAFWFGRVRVVLQNGGCAVLNRGSLNPLGVLAALAAHSCNSLSGDTPVFAMLLRHMERRLADLGPQLRWAKVASQPMALADKRKLSELLPNARIVMSYGLTEAMRCCMLAFEDHPDKLESVGRPCDTVELRVVDADGNALAPDTQGEIQVRGDNLASGYWRKDDLWRERMASGWLGTGDLGTIDADGFVTIGGRKDDAVNVGGRTVAPAEVEHALQPRISRSDFLVSARTDPGGLLGDILCLCVEGGWREPLSWKEFRVHLFETVPPSLVPTEAFVIPELPRTENGKVQRTQVRTALEAGEYSKL